MVIAMKERCVNDVKVRFHAKEIMAILTHEHEINDRGMCSTHPKPHRLLCEVAFELAVGHIIGDTRGWVDEWWTCQSTHGAVEILAVFSSDEAD